MTETIWIPGEWSSVKAGDTVRLENADGAVELTVHSVYQTRDCWEIRSTIGAYPEWYWNLFVSAPPTPTIELPKIPGIYEADEMPISEGFNAYQLKSDTWYELSTTGLLRQSKPEALAPFARLAPEAETANAVLKRVLDESDVMGTGDYAFLERTVVPKIAAEFGVWS